MLRQVSGIGPARPRVRGARAPPRLDIAEAGGETRVYMSPTEP
jgi:hypothetical protein